MKQTIREILKASGIAFIILMIMLFAMADLGSTGFIYVKF
jgi:hypothetical protein